MLPSSTGFSLPAAGSVGKWHPAVVQTAEWSRAQGGGLQSSAIPRMHRSSPGKRADFPGNWGHAKLWMELEAFPSQESCVYWLEGSWKMLLII